MVLPGSVSSWQNPSGTTNWPKVLQSGSMPSGFISNMSTHRQYFPQPEDETGAAKALMRLQDTYQLDSEAFSMGKLPGKPASEPPKQQLQLWPHSGGSQ